MLVAKFAEGAWITILFIPLTIVFFMAIRRHYHAVNMLTAAKKPVRSQILTECPIVVVPIDHWNDITRLGIEFAARLL